MRDVKNVGVKLGQNYSNLEWDLSALATSRNMWAAIVAATNNVYSP